MTVHLTSAEIGEFLEDGLETNERRRVVTHLAECDACRSEMVEIGRVARTGGSSFPRTWAAGLAAAAVLTLLVVQPWQRDTTPVDVLRDDVAAGARTAVEVVAPIQGTRLDGPARFVWRSVDPEAVYRFTLVSEAGEVIHSMTTSDTILGLPEEIPLGGGEEGYYWVVDALLPDGRTATTGAHRFRSGP